MRQLFLSIVLAIPAAAIAQGQNSFSDLRSIGTIITPRATQTSAADQINDGAAPQRSTDSQAIVAAIERLAGKFDRLQIQVDNQGRGVLQATNCTMATGEFDSQGRQILYDVFGRQVSGARPDFRQIIGQICPGCQSQQTQSHNFTSMPTLSPTSFSNIPMIDANNNMSHAVPRVIMVEGRPQLILDPEPIGWIGKLCPWTRR